MLSITGMFEWLDTRDPGAVQNEVRKVYLAMFASADGQFIPTIFGWAKECFTGHYEDYQPIDAKYHDFEHTLQGTLCLARLLQGYQRAKAVPILTEEMFRLAMIAILMHDTGYLKKSDDTEGTGAKYTLTHVQRSMEFAGRFLAQQGYSRTQIAAVQHMIRCTGVNVNLAAIPFQDELEKLVGFALGSSDLLGQMAANDYPDKLPILYEEFAESARHNAGKMTTGGNFENADDLIRKTPAFWEKYVFPKLERDFQGVFHYLDSSRAPGQNWYIENIENNIKRLREAERQRSAHGLAACGK